MKKIIGAIVVVVLAVAGCMEGPQLWQWWQESSAPKSAHAADDTAPPKPHCKLVADNEDALDVPSDVIETLGLQTAAVQSAPHPEPLRLDGTLFVDPNRMVHIHTRHAGEVTEMGQTVATKDEPVRALRYGDTVKKGQLLAVVWSKDLGEKKSEMAEALTLLRFDQERLKRQQDLVAKQAVPEKNVREAERDVETDLIAVSRVERTLRSWKMTDAEIAVIRKEATQVHLNKGESKTTVPDEAWGRVEIRSPQDGTIVEKNFVVGDVAGTELDLFKIADLTRLDVLAHAYEEDLPLLQNLTHEQRKWKIHLKMAEAEPLKGVFEQIGSIIDPTQHTALVMGWVDNSAGKLRVGQFITADVQLPVVEGQLGIPAAAVVDQDESTYVFVGVKDHPGRFMRQKVTPVARRQGLVFLAPLPAGDPGRRAPPLRPGDRVVTTGCVELAAELGNQRDAQPIVTRDETVRPGH